MRLLLLAAFAAAVTADPCAKDTCPPHDSNENTLVAHLVPHTHDDLGWIKTVDQYYYGARMDLVPVGVQYIYNTVIDELEKDPKRKFSFAETGFMWRWLASNGEKEKERLVKLVQNGQVEIIGGGWVQNDEAASHYVDIIDQMSLGLRELNHTFGECARPTVGWQIDPFGHSREMANLYALMGYTSLFFARVHYLEKKARLENKSLEFVWNASDDLKTNILTGAFFQDNYGPPEGFCFDALCGDDPIMDNEMLEGYNVPDKVNAFVAHVKNQASHQRTRHVMLLMGSDFQYTNANSWYSNLDRLIKAVNKNTSSHNVQVVYSTPSCYVNALQEAQPHLPTKSDDFFPYASSEHSFWTGYFTSRPALKGMIRDASALLQLAKQLAVSAHTGEGGVFDMSRASALAQHHDAVTGTAKENVTRDYELRLHNAMQAASGLIGKAVQSLSNTSGAVTMCPLLNETICEPISSLSTFSLTVLNPLGRRRQTVVRVPFYSKQAIVKGPDGQTIAVQLSKTHQSALSKATVAPRAPFQLFIPVDVPAMGYATYTVDNSTSVRSVNVTHPTKIRDTNATTTIENNFYRLTFDSKGLLYSITDKQSNETHPFKQQFYYYHGINRTSSQPSGAYIFRPSSTVPLEYTDTIKLETVQGELVSEARQLVSASVSQIIRLHNDSREVEFEWTVGPIPKEQADPITKEVVTRYYTDIKSNGEFFTDSNGRQMMKRKTNYHPSFEYADSEPVAGNYYPVTNRVFIRDAHSQLTVLPDRAQGASSRDGMIEIMLHRRCFADDHWGVEEALDEPGIDGKGLIATGVHRLLLGASKDAASQHRSAAVSLFHRPALAFSPSDMRGAQFAALTRDLSDGIHVLSLEPSSSPDTILLRLEHIYQNEEDKNKSRPETVDLKDLFTRFDIVSMVETDLGGVRELRRNGRPSRYREKLSVELKPFEIRTFLCTIKRK